MPNGVTWLSNSHNYDVFCYGQVWAAHTAAVLQLQALQQQAMDLHSSTDRETVVQNFVVQRPPVGGPGLVLSPQITQLQIVQEDQTTNLRGDSGLGTYPLVGYGCGIDCLTRGAVQCLKRSMLHTTWRKVTTLCQLLCPCCFRDPACRCPRLWGSYTTQQQIRLQRRLTRCSPAHCHDICAKLEAAEHHSFLELVPDSASARI